MNISVHAEADLTAVTHNDLANAVRFLAVDAIEASQSVIRVCRWAWPMSRPCCSRDS